MNIKSIMIHHGYNCSKPINDIAILELEKELQWSDSVSPACLPNASTHNKYSKFDNIIATVAGWGWTNEKNSKGEDFSNL